MADCNDMATRSGTGGDLLITNRTSSRLVVDTDGSTVAPCVYCGEPLLIDAPRCDGCHHPHDCDDPECDAPACVDYHGMEADLPILAHCALFLGLPLDSRPDFAALETHFCELPEFGGEKENALERVTEAMQGKTLRVNPDGLRRIVGELEKQIAEFTPPPGEFSGCRCPDCPEKQTPKRECFCCADRRADDKSTTEPVI